MAALMRSGSQDHAPRVEPPTHYPSPRGGTEFGPSSVDQEGKLALDLFIAALRDLAVEQAGRVVAGEVVVGELGAGGIAWTGAHGPVEAVYRKECEAVDA